MSNNSKHRPNWKSIVDTHVDTAYDRCHWYLHQYSKSITDFFASNYHDVINPVTCSSSSCLLLLLTVVLRMWFALQQFDLCLQPEAQLAEDMIVDVCDEVSVNVCWFLCWWCSTLNALFAWITSRLFLVEWIVFILFGVKIVGLFCDVGWGVVDSLVVICVFMNFGIFAEVSATACHMFPLPHMAISLATFT